MGTQEEFLDVLNQIKEQFPDLIPLGFNNFETDGTSSLGDKLQDFLGTPIVMMIIHSMTGIWMKIIFPGSKL